MSSAYTDYRVNAARRAARERARAEREREARRQAELERLRRSANMWAGRLRELTAQATVLRENYADELRSVSLDPPAVPTGDSLEALGRYVEQAERMWREKSSQLDVRLSEARARRMVASLSGDLEGAARTTAEVLAERGDSAAASRSSQSVVDTDRQRRQKLVERLLARLPAGIPQESLAELQTVAAEFMTSPSPAQAQTAELRLRHRLDRMTHEAERQKAMSDEAARLQKELEAAAPRQAPDLLAQLARVEAGKGGMTNDLRRRVREAIADGRARADHEYAAQVIPEALSELGYEVEEGFETLFLEDGIAHFQRPEWGNYAIRLRVEPQADRMAFNMIRFGEEATTASKQDIRDVEVEAAWCAEFPTLTEAFAQEGIELNIHHQAEAGDRSLDVASPDELRLPASRRRTETRQSRSRRRQSRRIQP